MNKKIAIGVHIGGMGIKSAAVDLEQNEIIPGTLQEGKVNKDARSTHILSLWAKTIRASIASINSLPLSGIGLSIPGPFDYAKGIASFEGVPKYGKPERNRRWSRINEALAS